MTADGNSNGVVRTRATGVILSEALAELRRRLDVLERAEEEIAQIRGAIKVLERAGTPRARIPAAEARGEVAVAMIAAIGKSLEPMTFSDVARAIGREPAPWIAAQLGRLVAAGNLVKVEDGYVVPAPRPSSP